MSTLPPPPAPEQQYAAPAPAKSGNGLGIAALILGILALIGAFIPFLNYGAWFLGLIGLVLGIVGLVQKNKAKGLALTGTILSGVAIILSIVLSIAYTAMFAAAVDSSIKESIKQDEAVASQPVDVVYNVTGTSTTASIVYTAYSDGGSKSESASDQALPWTKTTTVKKGGTFDFSSFSVTATAGQDGGDVACSITVDGKVVSEQKASGQFAVASCIATGTGD
ncbi:MmpS family transport accessory protein [Leifsonia sp. NPDC080035]|uniref:MmpS family transport accessory protein n=1 Tax=Leifsonia sp. NPDC080035 TaxID=3143936 RepID=A0AAU7GEZ8_9MICO